MKEIFGTILMKLDSLDQKVDSLDQKVDSVDQKVTKNSIEIESIKSDIKTIAEIQKAHIDQNERDHEKLFTFIDHEIGLHSIILKKLSSDVREIEKN
ncbi:hypothetical protein SBF1_5500003 [Candidatus Desulfosporosinus infrequens]|uniref:t-SNARE coiled-coil homology domain-containing protein n=1 Tax=Candidatus Desulfosporosinus infrequens TaxID=2043169 RepID=A0A2U3LJD5_9FIRM|nr:hypothetical protein SBF1_5500003 [Candidatus Desulfosporosinus infrequens]